jgi:hypothetical protein
MAAQEGHPGNLEFGFKILDFISGRSAFPQI